MSSQHSLRDQLSAKRLKVAELEEKITTINQSVHQLSQKFYIEAAKLQQKINRVQFSRPRGNPANQWPHCPMTPRVSAFYQTKEFKETELRKNKDLLKQVYDHKRAILTSQCLVLKNEQFDLESQIRLICIQLHE